MSKRTRELDSCQNCATPLTGDYCSECGQRNVHERLNLRELADEEVGHLASFDFRLIRTLKGMMLKPARVCHEYIGGQRSKYLHPIKYCFFGLAVVVILLNLLGVPLDLGASDRMQTEMREMLGDDDTGPMEARIQEQGRKCQRLVMEHQDIVMIIILPLFAMFLRLQYRKYGFNYTEILVFIFFIEGHTFLLKIPLILLYSTIPAKASLIMAAITIAYSAWAMISFFRIRLLKGLFMALLSGLLFVLTLMITIIPFMLIYLMATL
ncbi:MAG: DUF3667 domain-containing protein [bacterium]|nr:DUF3667 domain-containing protein [bacterium]